jgi:hypothetical protein
MFGNPSAEEVGAVDIDTPQLLDTLIRILLCGEVFREACRSDQMVNFVVF